MLALSTDLLDFSVNDQHVEQHLNVFDSELRFRDATFVQERLYLGGRWV